MSTLSPMNDRVRHLCDKLSKLGDDLEEGKQVKKERLENAIAELDTIISKALGSDE